MTIHIIKMMFLITFYHFSMKPNIYVGLCEGSSMYRKWYFEVVIDHFEAATHLPPVLRIGWANSKGFVPYPGGGEGWGCNGAGDDLYSFAYDGINLWTGIELFFYVNQFLWKQEMFEFYVYLVLMICYKDIDEVNSLIMMSCFIS